MLEAIAFLGVTIICARLNHVPLPDEQASTIVDALRGNPEEGIDHDDLAVSLASRSLSSFQVTTLPELRFRALLSAGVQEVRITHHLR